MKCNYAVPAVTDIIIQYSGVVVINLGDRTLLAENILSSQGDAMQMKSRGIMIFLRNEVTKLPLAPSPTTLL